MAFLAKFIRVFHFSVIVYLICSVISSTNADCNVCNVASNTACISSTEYQQCEDNKPFGNIYECNTGYYCSILGACSLEADLADCNDCQQCDATQTFACLGTKEFSLCVGGTKPSDIRAFCTGDLVCNINYKEICVEQAATCSYQDDTTTSTSTSTTTSTTTRSPAVNPDAFCGSIQSEGRFPIGTDAATTCHQYVHCLSVNGVWYGPIYNCPGNTYYDSAKRICTAQVPTLCSGNQAATCSYQDDTTTSTSTSTTTSTTTRSPAVNPDAFCGSIQSEGRFPIGTDAATTCHQYVHCLSVNGVWYGPIYNCPGNTYYDSAKRICTAQVPTLCSGNVTGLSFHNILLE